MSFILAQKGSVNGHYLLLGISRPLPGARLYVQLAFICLQVFLPFPLLPCPLFCTHCVSPAEGNWVNQTCAKGQSVPEKTATS